MGPRAHLIATVLRSGRTVGEAVLKETSEEELVRLMIEGGVAERRIEHPAETAGEKTVVLETEDLRSAVLNGVSLQLREGQAAIVQPARTDRPSCGVGRA